MLGTSRFVRPLKIFFLEKVKKKIKKWLTYPQLEIYTVIRTRELKKTFLNRLNLHLEIKLMVAPDEKNGL